MTGGDRRCAVTVRRPRAEVGFLRPGETVTLGMSIARVGPRASCVPTGPVAVSCWSRASTGRFLDGLLRRADLAATRRWDHTRCMGTRTAPEPIRRRFFRRLSGSVGAQQPAVVVGVQLRGLELHADRMRALPVVDPLARQMVISCGTALHHLEVAVAEHGLGVVIDRLPDPGNPMLLASVGFVSGTDSVRTRSLRQAIPGRWTDRRRSVRPLRTRSRASLRARSPRRRDHVPRGGRSVRLAEATRSGADVRRHDAAYRAELFWWTGHSCDETGVPASVLPDGGTVPSAGVPAGSLGAPRCGGSRCAGGPEHRHRHPAGLAAMRRGAVGVAARATARGLATCPLTHVTEIATSREMVREAATASGARGRFPQVVVRLGTPSADEYEVPRTGRRRVDDVWRDAGI